MVSSSSLLLSSLELSDTQSLCALNTSPPRNRFTFRLWCSGIWDLELGIRVKGLKKRTGVKCLRKRKGQKGKGATEAADEEDGAARLRHEPCLRDQTGVEPRGVPEGQGRDLAVPLDLSNVSMWCHICVSTYISMYIYACIYHKVYVYIRINVHTCQVFMCTVVRQVLSPAECRRGRAVLDLRTTNISTCCSIITHITYSLLYIL